MKFAAIIALGVAALPATAFAQANGAVNTDNKNQPAAAVSQGSNSYTEAQARDHIAKAGYSSIEQLKLDQNGIWTGSAMKGDRKVTVMLDFKGNISQR